MTSSLSLSSRSAARRIVATLMLATVGLGSVARAGSVAWLDDVVKDVIKETEAGAKLASRSADATGRSAGRLFAREAEQTLEATARRYDDFAKLGRSGAGASEVVLESRFQKLLKPNPDAAKAFATLAPAEKRMVVEMAEVAQGLAKKFPGRAEEMVRTLGTEGMAAVRVYGDDVAEVVAKEGAESLGVLRKTGAPGWKFYTEQVLKHKQKLVAAGVLAVFLADPDRFIDGAGQVTAYAVDQFAKAGVKLVAAVGNGVMTGLGDSFGSWLAGYGIDVEVARYVGMGLAGLTVLFATMILVGMPIRWAFKPFGLLFRLFGIGSKRTSAGRSV